MRNIGSVIRSVVPPVDFMLPFFIQICALGIPFLIVPVLSRRLGIHAFGEFAFCQAFTTVGAAIVDYGFQISAPRSLAQNHNDVGRFRDLASGVFTAKLLVGAGFVAFTLCFFPVYPQFFHRPALFVGSLTFALFQGCNFYWLFAGLRRVIFASFLDLSARLLAAIGVLALVHRPDQVWLAIWCFSIGNAVAFVCGCFLALRAVPGIGLSLFGARQSLRAGLHIFLQNVFGNIYVGATSFVLGLFVSTYYLGMFSGAEKLVRAAQLPSIPFRLAAYPRLLVRMQESREAGHKYLMQLARVLVPTMAAASLVLFFGAEPIVRLVLGVKMQPAVQVLRLMSPLPVLSAATDLLSVFWLLPTGRDRAVTGIVIAGLLCQVGVIALLSLFRPGYAGALGVLLAQLVAFALCVCVAWRSGHKLA